MTTNKKFIYKVPYLTNAHCIVQISQPDIEQSIDIDDPDDVIQLEIDSFISGYSTNVKIFFSSDGEVPSIVQFEKFKNMVNDAFLAFNKFNSMDPSEE